MRWTSHRLPRLGVKCSHVGLCAHHAGPSAWSVVPSGPLCPSWLVSGVLLPESPAGSRSDSPSSFFSPPNTHSPNTRSLGCELQGQGRGPYLYFILCVPGSYADREYSRCSINIPTAVRKPRLRMRHGRSVQTVLVPARPIPALCTWLLHIFWYIRFFQQPVRRPSLSQR